MAAKNIEECIDRALPELEHDLKWHLIGEIRDYFAHEVMRLEKTRVHSSLELFDHVFKDISPYKK